MTPTAPRPHGVKSVPCTCCGVLVMCAVWSDEATRVCGACGALGFPKSCPRCSGADAANG